MFSFSSPLLVIGSQVSIYIYINFIFFLLKFSLEQPSQNVPAAGNFAAYNKISAVYFALKLIENKDEFSTS